MMWHLSLLALAAFLIPCQLAAGEDATWPVEGQKYPKSTTGLPPYLKNLQEFIPRGAVRGGLRKYRKCGSKHRAAASKGVQNLEGQLLALKAGSLASAPIQYIKVYFHNRFYIDKKTNKQRGYISDDLLQKQLEVLNQGFAGKLTAKKAGLENDGTRGPVDARIVFYQAGSFDWPTYDFAQFRMTSGTRNWNTFRQTARVGGCESLNVFIHEFYDPEDPTEDTLGEATFPDVCKRQLKLDGLFIDHRTLPGINYPPVMLGRTLVHETGHWLGLFHVFQDKARVCTVNADEVADTPDGFETSGCPVRVPDNCRGRSFPGKDPIRNFLDYADDACMWKFTPGQAARMYYSIRKYRVA